MNDNVNEETIMNECVMRRNNTSKVRNHRFKSRVKDVYVVCEDLCNSVRKVKIKYDIDGTDNIDVSETPRGEMDEVRKDGSRL